MRTEQPSVPRETLLFDPSGNPIDIKRYWEDRERLSFADFNAAFGGTNRNYGMGVSATIPFRHNVWVYSCSTLTATCFSQIPPWLGRRSPSTRGRKRGFREIIDHPIIDLIQQPNDLMTQEVFFETFVLYLALGGNAWIYLDEPNSRGLPRQMLLYGTHCVRPNIDPKTKKLKNWFLKLATGKEQEIPLEDMIHFKLPSPLDPLMGLPPIASLQAQLDADYARVVFDRAFYRNNASPDAVLIYQNGFLSPVQRQQVRESWSEFHQGPDKAGGLAVMPGGFDFKVWGASHSQSEFIKNREFTREEVASAYKVPVLLLNATRGGALTREALDASQVALYEHAVFPYMKRFASPFNQRVVKKFAPNLEFGFDIDTLPVMTSYLQSKSVVFDKMVKNGIPPNEALVMLDLNMDPIEGGEKGYLPGNYVPLPELAKAKVMAPPSATPNAPPGKRPPSPKQAGSRFAIPAREEDVDFIVGKLRNKLKRILFNLRVEALKGDEVGFDVAAARRTWVRNVLPMVAITMQDRADVLAGKQGTVGRILCMDEDRRRQVFEQIQGLTGDVLLSDKRLEEELQRIVARSCELIDHAYDSLKDGEEPEDVFRSLNKLSRFLAIHIVSASQNAVDYVRGNGPRPSMGDPNLSLVESLENMGGGVTEY